MRLLTIFTFLLLTSCSSNIDIEVKDPAKVTTTEILQIAKADTVSYKKVIIDDTLYLVNNDEVKYMVINLSDSDPPLLIIFIFLILFFIFLFRID